jgi:hypothetical protein
MLVGYVEWVIVIGLVVAWRRRRRARRVAAQQATKLLVAPQVLERSRRGHDQGAHAAVGLLIGHQVAGGHSGFPGDPLPGGHLGSPSNLAFWSAIVEPDDDEPDDDEPDDDDPE